MDGDMKVKRKRVIWEEVEIPEAVRECYNCGGTGEIRYIRGGPDTPEQFRICLSCLGKGYLTEDDLKSPRNAHGKLGR